MKIRFYTKTSIALAVAIAAAAAAVSQAQEQPIPPPTAASALPADIVPGSPLAEVVKMVQAGVDADTIKTYILNSQSAFNLDADKILFVKDEGAPSDLINAMMERDKILYASTLTPAPVMTSPASPVPDTAPPAADVTVNYFNDTLTPYGSWVEVDGYGRCWRPTAVVYDSGWRPYCDRGHWVYTDCGWYWDSDYSWGVTFHYGRWFHHARLGWCWYPDTEWAPSWVTWRSGDEYCGWAPLPPFAVFRPGAGFFYRGASVGVDFDFGLDAGYFMFVSPEHFCDRHPRSFCLEPSRASVVFHQTRVLNDFNASGRVMMNRGIGVERISSVTHRQIEPVHVGELPNAGRQGWRGEGFNRPALHGTVENNGGRSFSGGNDQLRHGPAMRPEPNHNGGPVAPVRSQPAEPAGNHPSSRGPETPNHSLNSAVVPNGNPSPNNIGQTGDRQQRPNNLPATGIGHAQPVTTTPPSGTVPPMRPSNPVPVTGRTVSQNDWQQNRGVEKPVVSAPLEQHQFVAPSQPHVEAAPRSYSPPPAPPAPAPSQPQNAGGGSNRGSDKDKPNH